jgi:hypothetical protein
MSENRRNDRQLTFRTGKISGVDASDQIDCAVLNVSRSGACILVPDGATVAEIFELVIDREDGRRVCRRIWQDGSRIGLAFMDGMEQASRPVGGMQRNV